MRISDWSSDVCSSDLHRCRRTSDSQGRVHPAILLFAARALRDFGDGFVAVLLPVYLTALGLTPAQVGIAATAALLGSAFLTFSAGFPGVKYRSDARRVGKEWVQRVGLGGRRIIKKKKTNK